MPAPAWNSGASAAARTPSIGRILSPEMSLADATTQVQAPIVQRKRRMIGSSLLSQLCHELGPKFFPRDVLQVPPQNDVAHKFVILLSPRENRERRFHRGLDCNKPSPPQTLRRSLRILIEPGLMKAGKETG